MINLTSDLSLLTTIPDKVLEKLNDKLVYCISEAVAESALAEEEITELDVGFGTLFIKNDKFEPKFKFVPTENFMSTIKDSINNKLNSLEDTLNESLANKVVNVYKDIC